MYKKREWAEFRESGLLWWVNKTLHLFGWAICLDIENEKVIGAYPTRTNFRGFNEDSNDEGYKKLTNTMARDIDQLLEDVNDGI